jgi:hypothetical protein
VYGGMPDAWISLPSHGRVVMIHVSARLFRCFNVACVRKTFAERLDGASC